MIFSKYRKLVFVFLLIGTSQCFAATDSTHLSVVTLLPPLIAIVMAFLTKNVLVSLFIGVFTGAYLISIAENGFIISVFHSFIKITDIMQNVISDPWNAGIILQTLTIGGLIALISKMGGAKAIAHSLSKKAKSAKTAQFYTWFMGLFIFFDDYANALTVGPIMRPVTDKMKISREKLAFIIDATAAPIAGIALISTWIGYELGVINDGFNSLGLEVNAYGIFVSTIPYRFYNILILIFILAGIYMMREFGPMLKAERRARKGELYSENAKLLSDIDSETQPDENIKLSVWNAIIPIGVLIFAAFFGLYYNGYQAIFQSDKVELIQILRAHPLSGLAVRECFSESNAAIVLFQAALLASIVSIVMGISKKIFTLENAMVIWIVGVKSLLFTVVILTLAWSLSSVIKELNTAAYLVSVMGDSMPAFLLPSIIFILGAGISFATGTSYGTMGILMPLTIPLAYSITPDAGFMNISIAAVLTGAIFGDHCSPISDTTILASMGASCDHIDHTKTQLYYAIPVGIITVIFGYLPVSLGLSLWIVLPFSTLAIILLLRFAGKKVR